ncbi:MAG: hypothetical protein SGJ19_20245 [Planctomycetia bacterium]|nr:hypothetical protein [Planctomycetia bacterium]
MRVLFIGNSYTSVNNLPAMIQSLAAAGKRERPFEFVTLAPGGWTLQRHVEDEKSEAPKKIAEGKWDFVVMQEQSQMPFAYPDKTIEYGKKLAELAKEAKATPLWFMTWARENQADKQAAIAKTYNELAKLTESKVLPVGLAWEATRKQRPDLKLYNKDQSHPSSAGTYLAACVFYGVIYGVSPEGLPGKLMTGDPGKMRPLVELPKVDAAFLQKVAWEMVKAKIDAKDPGTK